MKRCLTKSTLPTDARGRVQYRGRWYTIDKPVKSTRRGKAQMVLASKNGCLKLVHFGDPNASPNSSEKKWRSYMQRSAAITNAEGKKTANDKHSANYWSRKIRWARKRGR